jgi:adenosine deaminase
MNIFIRLSCIFLFIINPARGQVDEYFQKVKNDPNVLYAFFKEMPKGGELHYHLAGGAYPEELLSQGKKYCIDPQTYTVFAKIDCPLAVSSVYQNQALYDGIIRAWSLKDFIPGKESSEDHFFATFFKFIFLVGEVQAELLADVIKRAAEQNELYLEVLMLPREGYLPHFENIPPSTNYSQWKTNLVNDPTFKQEINLAVNRTHSVLEKARALLHCKPESKTKSCNVEVKFHYYILRQQSIDTFFSQALLAFASAAISKDIVAINLVQQEDSPLSLENYHKQMHVIGYLHSQYPQVHISLHAGELPPGAVSPKELQYHIEEAIYLAKAERIGHGLDIKFENKINDLLKLMASKPVPVEINLTSNRKILGIFGQNHPLHFYLKHQVPVVLSTDDEGILRTDLTREYIEAATTYGLDYQTLKNINRNTLTYSFLPGKSLWEDDKKYIPTPVCNILNSNSCLEFIKHSKKAQLQWELERRLNAFENRY